MFSERILLNSLFILTFYTNDKFTFYCLSSEATKAIGLALLCAEGPWEKKKAENRTRNHIRMQLQKYVSTYTVFYSEKFF